MFTYNDAVAIATAAHAGQTDKIGGPYIDHLKAVVKALREKDADEKTLIVAMLEDVMGESTAYTREKLAEKGVPEDILEIVSLLTHHKDQAFIDDCSCKMMADAKPAEDATYEAREKEFLRYIDKVKQNPVARAVKTEALKLQLDENFIPRNERRELKNKFRIRKYQRAIEALEQ